MKNRALRLCVQRLLLLLALNATLLGQQEWPMFQHDANHTGYLPVSFSPQTASQRWTRNLAYFNNSSVCTGAGKVFVGTTANVNKALVALDQATGYESWRVTFPNAWTVNAPAFWNDRVYVQTVNNMYDTYLRCYNANTGALIFESPHDAQWEHYAAPTILDGEVYVNGGQYGGMYAFDAMTGAQLWFHLLPHQDHWTPAVDANNVYAHVSGKLTAVDRLTGATRYEITDPTYNWPQADEYNAPVLGGMNDIIATIGRTLVRFNLDTRSIIYTITATNAFGQPAVHDGTIYTVCDASLQARSQIDGSLLWSWTSPPPILRDAVVLTAGHAIVRSDWYTYAIDLTTHLPVWTYTGAGLVTLTQGAIYISQNNGNVTSIGLNAQPLPQAVEPPFRAWTAGPQDVVVRGTAFATDPTGTSVTVGGVLATNVNVLDDQRVRCTVTMATPGIYDVRVLNGFGSGTLSKGFAATPAVDVVNVPHPNSTLSINYYQSPHDQMLALLGFGTPMPAPLPPFQGTLCMDPSIAIGFLYLPGWVQPMFSVGMLIPNSPLLTGTNFVLQSVAGPSLWSLDGAFGNCLSLTIQ